MKRKVNVPFALALAAILAAATAVMAQRTSNRVLVINGHQGSAPVVQVGGRTYVDLEALAQITNGAVSFESNRIILTLPPPTAAEEASQQTRRLSREFATAALGALAQMREWKAAVETMIRFQVPVTGQWLQDYRDRADEAVRLAKVAASTSPDQSAFQLLVAEFNTLSQWAGNAVEQRQSLNATRTLSPDVLQNDQTLQKISNCSQFLGSMLVSGTFSDNPACH